ncbi:MAG: hypothetical protein ACHWZW_19040 [Spirulina sp.]
MEYWEFLLQQEGDNHWLPLDTAQMEILEGRYRIMAHTSEAHTPVRVQVSQRLLDQDPPKRRSFKRQGQTNADGLMVVIPFTRLQAGTWDIRCSSVPNAANSSEPATADESAAPSPGPDWAYSVQLQVLPPGVGDDEVWTLPPEDSPVAAPVSMASAPPAAPRPARPNLDLERTAAALDEAQSDLATGDAIQGWLHRIHLTQTALVGQEGAEVDLTGHITGNRAGESAAGMALVVRLVDPQTATAVALVPFALESATLPADMHLALTVPPNLETRLLLGELALVQTTGTAVSVLALQRFTLTVDLAALFDTIANQAEAETDYILDFAGGSGAGQNVSGEPREEITPSRPLDLPQGPPRSMPVFTLPRDGFNLPPKIYEPSPHEASAKQPTLPPFGATPRRPKAPTQSGLGADPASSSDSESSPVPEDPALEREDFPEALAQTSPPAAPTEDPQPSPPSESTTTPQDARPALSLPPLAPPPAANPTPKPSQEKPATPLLPSHEAAGFRDLKLQDRFWSRLNEMAVSIQQESIQRRSTQDTNVHRAATNATDDALAASAEPEPFAGEVVIYEDEDETLANRVSPTVAGASAGSDGETEEPIAPPVPEVEVPSGDLVAGEPVLVTLRVPFHPNRLYLKVWITDPQTRSLVDEPRQVMNLRPNGHGQLEGTLQMTAPLGCLEAEFEAIAVDMITQQESYKATVSRSIVPAGLDDSSLEEFDL